MYLLKTPFINQRKQRGKRPSGDIIRTCPCHGLTTKPVTIRFEKFETKQLRVSWKSVWYNIVTNNIQANPSSLHPPNF